MRDVIEVTVNGQSMRVTVGTSAAAAIALAGNGACRTSINGDPRAPLCGMGICFECRATVNGMPHTRTCQVICQAGMVIATDAS
jgi:D-hydroxyproline dehydrogenase subunit gamma